MKLLILSPPQTTQCWGKDYLRLEHRQRPHAGDDRVKARRRHDYGATITRQRPGEVAARARRKLLRFAKRASACCDKGFIWGFLGSLFSREASVLGWMIWVPCSLGFDSRGVCSKLIYVVYVLVILILQFLFLLGLKWPWGFCLRNQLDGGCL
ncbi:hypothetical protein V8G54_001983, partial [Vigna mungo]